VMNAKEKEITAYHEAGHAIVAHTLANAHPVNKVSIISRGNAGGFTWQLPLEDTYMRSVADYKDDLAVMLGGRMAEQIVFDEITTGAGNDLQQATKVARRMVMAEGMSKKLPNLVFGSQSDQVFLGREMGEHRGYSEEVAAVIDSEIAALIDEAADRAGKAITKYRDKVNLIAKKLLVDEVIDKDEFIELIGPRPNDPKPNDPRIDDDRLQDIGPAVPGDPLTA